MCIILVLSSGVSEIENWIARKACFCAGKRACIAEPLARQELFLFMTGIVQNFDVFPPEGIQQIDDKKIISLNIEPAPFEVRMISRFR